MKKLGMNATLIFLKWISMQLQFINITLKTVHMSDQLQMFEENNYQKSMSSPSEALAKTLVWLESVGEWVAKDQVLSLKQLDSSMSANHEFLSGKMLKGLSPQTLAKTLRQSSKPLPTLGAIDLNGNCVIQRNFYPKTDRGSTLSDILQSPQEISEEYFLSEKVVQRILNYRDTEQIPFSQDTRQEQTARTLVNVNSLHKK